ncbi:hypothetical protein CCACVL1_04996 [Corchorus capsularis]|uniref:Uncharacterized protein n=1 Tax=Corchorus capsularis TaxID=210143 RepID=A0A1R3JNL9_COCAP|nr:hypothetical protein CCACVL1_04996 [Corchorus capsularis]
MDELAACKLKGKSGVFACLSVKLSSFALVSPKKQFLKELETRSSFDLLALPFPQPFVTPSVEP